MLNLDQINRQKYIFGENIVQKMLKTSYGSYRVNLFVYYGEMGRFSPFGRKSTVLGASLSRFLKKFGLLKVQFYKK